jgi:integrase/recombinase XerD
VASVVKVDTPERWAVLDAKGVPISRLTGFLRYSHAVERSTNTVKAYASDLAQFFSFLESSGQAWTSVNNETLGLFIRHMRTPQVRLAKPSNPIGQRSAATVNRALAAIASYALYLYDATNDPVYGVLSRTARHRVNERSHRDGISATVGPRLQQPKSPLIILNDGAVTKILDACLRLRDRFLFTLLDETGMRIGQALLLRHSDIRVSDSLIMVQRHASDDLVEARNKSTEFAAVPVSAGLIRLYAAYMHREYLYFDSDFVFVNLWGGKRGSPLTYKTVEKLVARIRSATRIDGWSAHTFRHTYVSRLRSKGVRIETISYLVTHSSVATTIDTYSHLDVEEVRRELIESGVWSRES